MTAFPLLRVLLICVVFAALVGIVVLLVNALKKKDNTSAPVSYAAAPTPASTPVSTSSYGSTAKIFVNGGAPSSNIMGKISVDGKSLSVLYSEAPLEITISTGRHHIVVEGGHYGDARIDRYIDFDSLDVWTVDLPGRDDADLIRHQMISYSDYRSALSSSGFTVTRKHL